MVTEHGLRPRDVLWQTHEQLNAVLLYVWSVFGVSKRRGPDVNNWHKVGLTLDVRYSHI